MRFLSIKTNRHGARRDSAVAALARACPQLRGLVLTWAWLVTDVGLAALLAGTPLLTVLVLSGAKRLGGAFLTAIPCCLPYLTVCTYRSMPDCPAWLLAC